MKHGSGGSGFIRAARTITTYLIQPAPSIHEHAQQVALEVGNGDGGGAHRVYLETKDYDDKAVKCLIAVLRPKHTEQVRGRPVGACIE